MGQYLPFEDNLSPRETAPQSLGDVITSGSHATIWRQEFPVDPLLVDLLDLGS